MSPARNPARINDRSYDNERSNRSIAGADLAGRFLLQTPRPIYKKMMNYFDTELFCGKSE
jgi:hypothetical protein